LDESVRYWKIGTKFLEFSSKFKKSIKFWWGEAGGLSGLGGWPVPKALNVISGLASLGLRPKPKPHIPLGAHHIHVSCTKPWIFLEELIILIYSFLSILIS
jgi:hypothetical protein